MRVLSFAQNREDVLLWRALGHLDPATHYWVDLGAAHPVDNSVTKWFSLQGWTGINVEPTGDAFAESASDRPGDVNLNVAVGAEDGSAIFFEVTSNTELSTFDATLAASYQAQGMDVKEIRVEVSSLATIVRDHSPAGKSCAFLKIDVEGHERSVIEGCDWARFRPFVIMAEANEPDGWHDLLQEKGYKFILDDGLNFVYTANECAPEIAAALARPVSSLDDHLIYRYSLAGDERRSRVAKWASSFVATEIAAFASGRGHSLDAGSFTRLAELFVARADLQRAFAGDNRVNCESLLRWATTTDVATDPEIHVLQSEIPNMRLTLEK